MKPNHVPTGFCVLVLAQLRLSSLNLCSGIRRKPPLEVPGLAQALRMGEEKYGETRLQVITDIDDTVKSSGGLRLLGKLGVNIGLHLHAPHPRTRFHPVLGR